MKTATNHRFADFPKDYQDLCSLLMPRPIHDEVELSNVSEITEVMAGHELSNDQEDYFDLLCRLIEDYEREQVVEPEVHGLDVLNHLLEAHDMSAAALSRLLGASRTLGAMILRGDRKLTAEHVRTLSKHFSVSADLFLK